MLIDNLYYFGFFQLIISTSRIINVILSDEPYHDYVEEQPTVK